MNIDVSPSCALVNDKYCLIALADAAITILIFKGFVVEMDYTRGVLHVERCQLKRHIIRASFCFKTGWVMANFEKNKLYKIAFWETLYGAVVSTLPYRTNKIQYSPETLQFTFSQQAGIRDATQSTQCQ